MDYLKFLKKNKIISILIFLAIICLLWYIFSPVQLDNIIPGTIGTTGDSSFPPIKRYNNLFTPQECQAIINIARPRLQRSTLGVNTETGEERTSYQVWLKRTELPCLIRCSNFVAQISGLPVENQEDWQVLRYEPGQQYTAHYDACSATTKEYEDCIADEKRRGWGKRVYTFFIYLNDVEEGGETYFPKLNQSFSPQPGSAIFWHNLTADGSKSHPFSEHAGMPVKKGVKWAINVWIRERPEKMPQK
jgi:prolyl 4-hydroxylase